MHGHSEVDSHQWISQVDFFKFTKIFSRMELFHLMMYSTHFIYGYMVKDHSWCDWSSDRSLMVDPLSCFSFKPMLHDWCEKDVVFAVLSVG